MAISSKKSSFNKILILVFGVAFGLVALALAYQGVKTNSDIRSRAAQQAVDYKRWDFTNDAEGWVGQNVQGVFVSSGMLYVTMGVPTGAIKASGIDVTMPKGNKYVGLSLAKSSGTDFLAAESFCSISSDGRTVCVTPSNNGPGQVGGGGGAGYVPLGQGVQIPTSTAPCVPKPTCPAGQASCPELLYYPAGGWCPSGTTPTSKPTATPKQPKAFSFSVYYWLKGEDTNKAPQSKPLTIKGTGDGVMKDYSLMLPQVRDVEIVQVMVQFDRGVVAGNIVRFDAIRLYGPRIAPTPVRCTTNGASCTITNCPPMPTCPPGTACTLVMPICTAQRGICQNNRCVPYSTPTPTPTPTPPPPKYTCPSNGWVDCMPVMDAAKKARCSQDAMAWYKLHCPNFHGGAY